MKLIAFLKTKKISQKDLAEIAGLSSACIHNYIKGTRPTFNLEAATRIELATNGAVTVFDLLDSKQYAEIGKEIKGRLKQYNKTLANKVIKK